MPNWRLLVKGDQAAIESASVTLGYATIRSPIDGRTGIRQIDPGNIIHASDATGLVTITQMRPISLLFTLPEENLGDVISAMASTSLRVSAWSRDGKRLLDEGILQLVDNQIDQTTGNVKLKATLPNRGNHLWPGQYVNARLLAGILSQVLVVPSTAIQRGPDGAFVYVVRADSTVEVRPLVTGSETEKMTVIESGLNEGEQVVTSGQYRLQPGSRIQKEQTR